MTPSKSNLFRSLLLTAVSLLLLLSSRTTTGTVDAKRLTRQERKKLRQQEADTYAALRRKGVSEVGHDTNAKILRDYKLRKKKRKGLIRKHQADLASVLFPGVSPEVYLPNEPVFMITELVQSKKTHVPFEFYDLPLCKAPPFLKSFKRSSKRHQRKNLGARLQGMELKPAPFVMRVLEHQPCQRLCEIHLNPRMVKWMRKLVYQQYRVHLTFDQLPVLMRSGELNYAVRGYPLGFKAPPEYTGKAQDEYFLYNHLKFTIHYQKRDSSASTARGGGDGDGVLITGFDVYPVSIEHTEETCPMSTTSASANRRRRRLEEEVADSDEDDEDEQQDESSVQVGSDEDDEDDNIIEGEMEEGDEEDELDEHFGVVSDAQSMKKSIVENDPSTYLNLRVGAEGQDFTAVMSYEVEWVESETSWADRWDVYLIGSPDDDIHFFAIINSLMIVMFLTGAIASIMIRTLKKDISAYNEMAMIEDGGEETGWKLVHGDVFRPPRSSPLALSVMVGTGAQIGLAFFITLVASVFNWLNPIKKGHTLTAMVVVYVMCGSVSGYVSARVYKFCDGKNWKLNTFATSTALPGLLVGMFTFLNVFLGFAGAATSVSFLTLLAIFALWVCVSTPLVFVGSFFGFGANRIEVPTRTNQIARIIPESPWYSAPPVSYLMGGVLPFGSVCIELFFIMSALWLHQIYYVMGFLLAVLLILAATCAQVSIVMDYLQLCAEDHRWWWKSFFNCATAGFYLLLYSLWFLFSRLDLVGWLPVLVYLTYMSMISLCFALFCGSVGFLCAFWFNKTIYGALKVD